MFFSFALNILYDLNFSENLTEKLLRIVVPFCLLNLHFTRNRLLIFYYLGFQIMRFKLNFFIVFVFKLKQQVSLKQLNTSGTC